MNGGVRGLAGGPGICAGDHIDNLEGRIASDTVNTEVNPDSYRCIRLPFAG